MGGHQFASNTNKAATKVYPCRLLSQGAALPESDTDSNGVEPALGFVIKNHQTMFSMSYLFRLWSTLLRHGLQFVQWHRTCNPVKEQDPIVYGRTESPNTILQAIDLKPSCLKQAHFKRLGTGHG